MTEKEQPPIAVLQKWCFSANLNICAKMNHSLKAAPS